MLFGSVGLTAIDVSLCGPPKVVVWPSQSVLKFGPDCGPVVQIAVPVFVDGDCPKTAPATGAGASLTLWLKSTGCGSSSPSAVATPTASASAARAARANPPLRGTRWSLIRLLSSALPAGTHPQPNQRFAIGPNSRFWQRSPRVGEEDAMNRGIEGAPGRNRTSARGLGNRCSIH